MSKELSELTLEELWILFPIILKDHNEAYKEWYQEIKSHLRDTIGEENILRVNHIGSTCVKGLLAKPTLDILLEIDEKTNLESLKEKLSTQGWFLMQAKEEPGLNYVFNKGYTKSGFAEKVYHLHVRYLGDWDELYFRDYLKENEDVREQYANLKLSLLKKYKNNRDGYTEAKTDFIKVITLEARKSFGNRYKINL